MWIVVALLLMGCSRSTVVNAYEMWFKERKSDELATGSLMHVESKGWTFGATSVSLLSDC